MKSLSFAGLLAGTMLLAPRAHADQVMFHGADAMAFVMFDAINFSGLSTQLTYLGGGSDLGMASVIAARQNIAPMSRGLTDSEVNALLDQGVTPVENVIGLDSVTVYVNPNNPIPHLDVPALRAIYTCAPNARTWQAIAPNSGMTGPINPHAANVDLFGITESFKTSIGVTTFGSCVALDSELPSNDLHAIGFERRFESELTNVRAVPLVNPLTNVAVRRTEDTIRDASYPLTHRLYIDYVTDGRVPSAVEQALLDQVLDRSFLDPILVANQITTCPPVEDGGCP